MQSNIINIFFKNLKSGDHTVRPFKANKTWGFSSDNIDMRKSPSAKDTVWKNINTTWIDMIKRWILNLGTSNVNVDLQLNSSDENIHINAYRFYYPENDKYFGNILNISSSLYSNNFTHQPIDPKILWYYLDHNFYKDYFPDKFASLAIDDNQSNILSDTGSILILPRNLYGEGMARGTFEATMQHTDSNLQYKIIDDGDGNLIDTTFDQSTFVDYRSQILSIGFNEKYREYNFINRKKPYVIDTSNLSNTIKISNTRNISYKPGITTTDTNEPTGICAAFDGAYLEVFDDTPFNFSSDLDFAFSFWINTPISQSSETFAHNSLFNKKSLVTQDKFSSKTGVMLFKEHSTVEQFPFDISITNTTSANPYSILFAQSSNIERVDLVSSQITPNEWTHVLCQKSGSEYQIWLNGQLNVTQSYTITNSIQNDRHFIIGSDGLYSTFSGSLDEIKVFNKALSPTEIYYLSDNSFTTGSAYQTAKIGSVFYDRGLAIVSDFRPKYANAFLGRTGILDYEENRYGFDSNFKTSTTFYQHEIICRIPKTEFNMTQNASTYTKYDKKQKPKKFVSNTEFRPYFTTIGLYDDNDQLLAVAKLASPIRKRKDIDTSIIIRFDM